MPSPLSPAATALIQRFEGCPARPEWPEGDSGITIGWGCDIGADPDSLEAWSDVLPAESYTRLQAVKGVTGDDAGRLVRGLRDIAIPAAAAEAVFTGYTLPREIAKTLKAFPGSDQLPADSFGALVSLVYNRGARMTGDRRSEMRDIRDALSAPEQWPTIPGHLRAMVRLWPERPPTAWNLPGRRLAEAALFDQGLRTKANPQPNEGLRTKANPQPNEGAS